jgi:GAF domain-containing protein
MQQQASAEILRAVANASGEVARPLQQIAETTARLFGAPSASIQLAEAGEFTQEFRVGAIAQRIGSAYPRSNIRVGGRNLPGTVVSENRQIHIPDLDRLDPSMSDFPGLPHARAGGARTVCGTPLRREGNAIGVLIVFRNRLLPFTADELALLQSFADQAVIAIENARLFNETREALERQAATSDILRVISQSPTDVQPVFDAIVTTSVRLTGCDLAFFLRCHGATYLQMARATPEGLESDARPPQPIDPDANFPSRAIVGKKTLHLPDWSLVDLPAHERRIHENFGIVSSLYLPLVSAGECIGLLVLAGKRANIFGASEIALAESFRDQAVIAIQNARLFNETREALERQTATADILKVIASSPDDVQPVFEAIAERSKRLVDALSTTVFRLEDGMMHLKAFTRTSPEADATLKAMFPAPLSNFSWGEPISNGDIHRVIDTEQETADLRGLARLRGFRSMLFVPLLRDRKPVGVIAVTRVEPGPFTEHHVQLLQTFADQAVIAIGNVHLFDEVQARTRDLTEALQQQTATADVLKVISRSAFDLQTVLETLTRSAVELCGANRGIVTLRDGELFHFRAHSHPLENPDWIRFLKLHPQKAGRNSASARAIQSGEIVCVPDVLADPEIDMPATALAGIRAVLAVPLLRDGKVEGLMVLSRPIPGAFNPRQIDLVQTFADQAVIAIENVRLFDEVQTRTKELAASLDDLRAAQDRLVQTEKLASLGQLTAGIAHEIKNPLNFVNNFAALSAELIGELNDVLKPAALDDATREELDELTRMLTGNLEKVVQHGKRADSIVKNMLLHSREGSGEHRPADINAIVEESLNLAYHGARAEKAAFNVTLQRNLDPQAGLIDLHPQEMTRVFLNLISNGFYAVAKRKEAGEAGFEPVLSAATRNLGDRVEIRIRDNGTGIPIEVKEKMFNPFFTTKPAGEGTGLGLSMSHDIVVKQHGGRIDVETEPGLFTEFIITLPRTAAAKVRSGGRN